MKVSIDFRVKVTLIRINTRKQDRAAARELSNCGGDDHAPQEQDEQYPYCYTQHTTTSGKQQPLLHTTTNQDKDSTQSLQQSRHKSGQAALNRCQQQSLKRVKEIFKIPVYLYRLAKQILFLAIHQHDRYQQEAWLVFTRAHNDERQRKFNFNE